jgi:hypothetical protein
VHGFRQIKGCGDARHMILQPAMQGLDNWATSFLADLMPVLGGLATDPGLDRVEPADARQHLGRQRRLGRDVEVVEAPAHMGPAERQPDGGVGTTPGQPLEAVIAIDLQDTLEPARCSAGRAFLRSAE